MVSELQWRQEGKAAWRSHIWRRIHKGQAQGDHQGKLRSIKEDHSSHQKDHIIYKEHHFEEEEDLKDPTSTQRNDSTFEAPWEVSITIQRKKEYALPSSSKKPRWSPSHWKWITSQAYLKEEGHQGSNDHQESIFNSQHHQEGIKLKISSLKEHLHLTSKLISFRKENNKLAGSYQITLHGRR